MNKYFQMYVIIGSTQTVDNGNANLNVRLCNTVKQPTIKSDVHSTYYWGLRLLIYKNIQRRSAENCATEAEHVNAEKKWRARTYE